MFIYMYIPLRPGLCNVRRGARVRKKELPFNMYVHIRLNHLSLCIYIHMYIYIYIYMYIYKYTSSTRTSNRAT